MVTLWSPLVGILKHKGYWILKLVLSSLHVIFSLNLCWSNFSCLFLLISWKSNAVHAAAEQVMSGGGVHSVTRAPDLRILFSLTTNRWVPFEKCLSGFAFLCDCCIPYKQFIISFMILWLHDFNFISLGLDLPLNFGENAWAIYIHAYIVLTFCWLLRRVYTITLFSMLY